MRRDLQIILPVALAVGYGAGGPGAAELTEEDSGSTIAVGLGEELLVRLGSNLSTGWRWDLDGELPQQLEQVGEVQYFLSPQPGAGGTEEWRFRAKTAGDALLRMKYWRSFEPAVEPARAFVVTARVK